MSFEALMCLVGLSGLVKSKCFILGYSTAVSYRGGGVAGGGVAGGGVAGGSY